MNIVFITYHTTDRTQRLLLEIYIYIYMRVLTASELSLNISQETIQTSKQVNNQILVKETEYVNTKNHYSFQHY